MCKPLPFITLNALFSSFRTRRDAVEELIKALPLTAEGEIEKCIPFSELSVEMAVYWLSLIEFLQEVNFESDDEDRLQDAICELSTFCDYLTKYVSILFARWPPCNHSIELFSDFRFSNYMKQAASETDENQGWTIQENQYKFQILIEILLKFDLGDEIGRRNLKTYIMNILSTETLEEGTIQKLVQCVENLIPELNERLQYFIDIVRSVIEPNSSIDFTNKAITQFVDNIRDPNIKVQVSALKLKILELREQETNASIEKDYTRLEKVSEELNGYTEEFIRLVNEYTAASNENSDLSAHLPNLSSTRKLSVESITHCLQICFYAIASKHTETLTPNMCHLYEDFIRRQMKSKQMVIRDWAIRCGATCSMLYENLTKDVYTELYMQFYLHHNTRIWTTSISATFELIDKYGFDYFEAVDDGNKISDKSKKTRQLYDTMGYLDETSEEESSLGKTSVDLMYLFGHFLDTCSELSIIKELVKGFCRLVLTGHYEKEDLVSKLMLKFFNPATDAEINQILAIFFETLIKRKRQECLAKALMKTLNTILEAPNDSPLHEVKPESVIKFVISSTLPMYCSAGLNIHNDIALQFLSVMNDNPDNKDLLKLLSKELLTLEVSDDHLLRTDLENASDNLLDRTLDGKTEEYIQTFKKILAGTYEKDRRTVAVTDADHDGDEVPSDEEDTRHLTRDNESNRDIVLIASDVNNIEDETQNNSLPVPPVSPRPSQTSTQKDPTIESAKSTTDKANNRSESVQRSQRREKEKTTEKDKSDSTIAAPEESIEQSRDEITVSRTVYLR